MASAASHVLIRSGLAKGYKEFEKMAGAARIEGLLEGL